MSRLRCDQTGPFGGAMPCVRPDAHDAGHVYEAAWAADGRHEG